MILGCRQLALGDPSMLVWVLWYAAPVLSLAMVVGAVLGHTLSDRKRLLVMAVAIVPWTSTGIAEDGTRFPRPGRATIVLERSQPGAPWVGVHTHFSLARGVPSSTFGRRPPIR